MAKNLTIQDEPVYNEQMEVLEPTTPAHADYLMSDMPSFSTTEKPTAGMRRSLRMT